MVAKGAEAFLFNFRMYKKKNTMKSPSPFKDMVAFPMAGPRGQAEGSDDGETAQKTRLSYRWINVLSKPSLHCCRPIGGIAVGSGGGLVISESENALLSVVQDGGACQE